MNAVLLLRAPIALIPVLLFLLALVQLDAYKLLRLRLVLAMVGAGGLAAGASYLINNYAYTAFSGDFTAYSHYVSPWIEECLKAVLVVFLIRTRRVGVAVDAGIAGFAIGTGFALVENLYYLGTRPDAALAVQVIRGFGTAIMHGGTAALLAMISITLYEKRPHGGPQLLLPGFLAAVALHTAFNMLLVRPALATLAILVVLPVVIHLVFRYSERSLRAWLDADLESNVQLLESITTGTFLNSPSRAAICRSWAGPLPGRGSGGYALLRCDCTVNWRYAPRGVLMLRESGIDEAPIDAETRDKLAELAQLKRAIGKAGVLALRPLMMATGKDIWELTTARDR